MVEPPNIAASEKLIVVREMSFHYSSASRSLFDGVSLDIQKGEVIGILGESGSGKTTLLKLLAGLEEPTAGSVVQHCSTKGSFVFQAPIVLDWLNVKQNITFPDDGSPRDGDINETLRDVELQSDGHKYPRELSGGMRSRVQLARALYRKPSILFLDEAFSALDEKLRYQLNLLVKRLRDTYNFAAVMISHSVHEAVFLSDRILVLKKPENGPTQVSEISDGLRFSRSSQEVWDTPEFGYEVASVRQRLLSR